MKTSSKKHRFVVVAAVFLTAALSLHPASVNAGHWKIDDGSWHTASNWERAPDATHNALFSKYYSRTMHPYITSSVTCSDLIAEGDKTETASNHVRVYLRSLSGPDTVSVTNDVLVYLNASLDLQDGVHVNAVDATVGYFTGDAGLGVDGYFHVKSGSSVNVSNVFEVTGYGQASVTGAGSAITAATLGVKAGGYLGVGDGGRVELTDSAYLAWHEPSSTDDAIISITGTDSEFVCPRLLIAGDYYTTPDNGGNALVEVSAGGRLAVTEFLRVGVEGSGTGRLTVGANGEVDTNVLSIGDRTTMADGTVIVNGGTVDANYIEFGNGNGSVEINGGTVNAGVVLNGEGLVKGEITLDGGTLDVASQLQLDDLSSFAFPGGTLRANSVLGDLTIGDGSGSGDAIHAPEWWGDDMHDDYSLLSDAQLAIELFADDHDHVLVHGDAYLDGLLSISEDPGFTLQPNQEFEIIDVDGTLNGTFSGLAEGALVGNYDETDLFITYEGDDGNDVLLYTPTYSLWNEPAGGLFGVAANWSPAEVPDGDDMAMFNLASATGYDVTFGANVTNYRLIVRDDTLTLDLAGHNYTLTSTDPASPSIVVGQSAGDVADLTISGGTVEGVHAQIGRDSGSDGTVTVNGAASAWNTTSLYVGGSDTAAGGTGTLTIGNGGEVTVGNTLKVWTPGTVNLDGGQIIADTVELAGGAFNSAAGSSLRVNHLVGFGDSATFGGSLQLGQNIGSGPGSHAVGAGQTLQVGESLGIGHYYDATLTIGGGGQVSVVTGTIGFAPLRTGTVNINGAGSDWTNLGDLIVGLNGIGIMNVTGGATVSNDIGYVAQQTPSAGTVTVDGADSTWTNGGTLYVGYRGDGTLDVTNGGTVSNADAYVSIVPPNSDSTVTVEDAGSTWTTNGSLYVGPGAALPSPTGLVTVQNGGTANVTGTLEIRRSGKVELFGGEIHTGSFLKHPATTFTHTGGTLTVDGGTFNPGSTSYTIAGANNPTLTLTGGAIDTLTGSITVGTNADGTLNVSGDADLTTAAGYIAAGAGSNGSVTVSGAGSTWTNDGSIYVGGNPGGPAGNGLLTIELDGSVQLGGQLRLWDTATLILNRGSVNTASFSAMSSSEFYHSAGTLTIDGGSFGPGSANYEIDGAGNPTVTLTDGALGTLVGYLRVADESSGTLNLTADGDLSTEWAYVGYGAGSTGTALVDGGGSTWNVGTDLYVGGDADSAEGTGTVTVQNDGSLIVGNLLQIWSSGTVELLGSSINAGSFYVESGGTFTHEDGTLTIDGGAFSPGVDPFTIDGAEADDLPTVILTAGAIGSLPGEIIVGDQHDGRMEIEGGSWLLSADGYLGNQSSAEGTVIVDGAGSTWNLGVDRLFVGHEGAGLLGITDQGNATAGAAFVGWDDDSDGTVLVSDSGSSFDVAGNLYIGGGHYNDGADHYGGSGTGWLFAYDGTTTTSYNAILGYSPGSNGTATLDGATWNLTGTITVGKEGTGTLTIGGGGQVTADIGFIGSLADGEGTVTVTGATSNLTCSELLVVGGLGQGTLDIEQNGTVNSDTTHIGESSGSSGEATVGDTGSTWTNTGSMFVGGSNIAAGGTGSLTVEEDGLLDVGDSLKIWPDGTVNLDSGMIISDEVELAGGTFNMAAGTTLRVNTLTGFGNAIPMPGMLHIGHAGGSGSGSHTVGAGQTLGVAEFFVVGYNAVGVLEVTGGGGVSCDTDAFIALQPASIGTATVTGAGSTWTIDNSLYVGGGQSAAGGAGQLVIETGATVTVIDTLKIWGTGRVDIDGGTLDAGSIDRAAGGVLDWTTGTINFTNGLVIDVGASPFGDLLALGTGKVLGVAGDFIVGENNSGSLSVGGGDVTSGASYIGHDEGAYGLATLNGAGSVWDTSTLYVGHDGNGTLEIYNGAEVTSTAGHVGFGATGDGGVEVSDAGSTWDAGSTLNIGDSGIGDLVIDDGGAVSCSVANVAVEEDSQGTVTVDNGSTLTSTGGLTVGLGGIGALDVIADATVSSPDSIMAMWADSQATVTVSGGESQWDSGLALMVGYNGTAILNVTGGAEVTNVDGYIAAGGGSDGTATVSGTDSTWTNTGSLYVGGGETTAGGAGTLTVDGDGTVNVAGTIQVWPGGTVELLGSQINTGSFLMEPAATFTHDDGTLTVDGGTFDPGTADYTIDGSGNPTVTLINGAGTALSGDLHVADAGNGTLNVLSGSNVSNDDCHVGYQLGSSGAVVVDGAGTTWINTGRTYVGYDGTATLDIENGATVMSTADYSSYIAYGEDGEGTVLIDNATWTLGQDLDVGNEGTATLTVRNEGQLANRHSYLGAWPGSDGTATVDGATWSLSGTMRVGSQGAGSLQVQNGGQVTTSSAEIGAIAGSYGSVTIEDADSTWSNLGLFCIGGTFSVPADIFPGLRSGEVFVQDLGELHVDYSLKIWEPGRLYLNDGGLIVAEEVEHAGGLFVTDRDATLRVNRLEGFGDDVRFESNLQIGYGAGPGVHEVGFGQEIYVGHDLVVGYDAEGAFGALAGGDLSCQIAYIGYLAGAEGRVAINGSGSTWNVGGHSLHVGYEADGTLEVLSGGRVTSAAGYLGNSFGSEGHALVDGAGSNWAVGGNLYVGGNAGGSGGTATLEVSERGTLEVVGTLKVWPTGSLAVYGGEVVADSLEILNLTGLRIDGGSVRVANEATLNAGTSLVLDDSAELDASTLHNYGTIRGDGTIDAALVIHDTGLVRATAADYLEISGGGPNTNEGHISIIGGTIEFASHLTNELDGLISGRGGLVFDGGMTNHGEMNFGADTEIYGDVANGPIGAPGADGEVVISGGASVSFHGDVASNGVKFKVNENANVVFFGTLSGEESITGGGGIWIEGTFSPGNSPAWVREDVDLVLGSSSNTIIELAGYTAQEAGNSQYDVIEIIGGHTLALVGTLTINLLEGFEPSAGSTFDIYRYAAGNRIGEFDVFDSPTWGNGRHFDITYNDTVITITAVPEPCTLALLICGAMTGLVWWRHRRR